MERRKNNSHIKPDSIRKNKSGRSLVIVFGALTFILMFVMAFEGIKNWRVYEDYLGQNSPTQTWLNGRLTSFSQDSYDMIIVLHRLQIAAMSYEDRLNDRETLDVALKATIAHHTHFAKGGRIEKDFKLYDSYPEAIKSSEKYLSDVKKYEYGKISTSELRNSYNDAIDNWMLLNADTVTKEFSHRDEMENAIIAFKPIYGSQLFVNTVLFALCLATVGCAIYFGWKLINTEQSRFEALETLIASIGHDLRSPLQTIQTASGLLSKEESISEKERWSAIIKGSANTLARLVDDIVQIARRENLSYSSGPVNIEEWFNYIKAIYKAKVESKGLKWIEEFDCEYGIFEFDRDRLTQCVSNLLENAIRYTKDGSITFSLKTRTGSRGDQNKIALIAEVIDTGIGISKEDHNRIFIPFERASTVGRRQGMGLGLSIVRSLTSANGGSIDLESSIGNGSKFTLMFPISASINKSIASKEPKIKYKPIPPETTSFNNSNEVLIVEDDDSILTCISGLMKDAGFSIDCSKNGQEGLFKLSQCPFEVVLTDIEMPEMDGFELAKHCSEMEQKPFLIAMTAHTNRLELDPRAKMFDLILTKPVNDENLLDAIEHGLEQRRVSINADEKKIVKITTQASVF